MCVPFSRPRGPLHRLGALFCLLLALLATTVPRGEAAAQASTPAAEAAFAEAYKLFSDQIYREAIQGFSDFRGRYPAHLHAAEALYYQAEASLALGLEDEAVRLFTLFERAHPTHPLASQARLALGKYFYEHARYDRALATFETILAEHPPAELAAQALYWMGEAARHQDDVAAALRYYQRAADEYRQTTTAPTALYTIGFTQVQQQQYDAAARAFEVLAARYPESPYARNIGLALAEIYYELNDYQRTVAEIQQRLPQLGPEARERAMFLMAESYNQLRDSENAILNYRYFTEQHPESPYYRRALYGLAWNYYHEGVHQWAVDNFAQARADHDDELAMQATYYEGVNQKLAERPMEAIARYRELVDRWPESPLAPHALFELGVTYYEQNMWQEAHETFTRLLEAHPDAELVGEALYRRGNTAIALGRFDEALDNFDRAARLDAAPAALQEEVVFQKAWLLYRNEQYREAAPAFMALYENAPRSEKQGEALFWAAESHYQLGHLDRAVALFQEYLRTFQGGRQVEAAHYALGWAFFKQGRYGEAVTQFRQFLDAYRVQGDYVPYRTDALLRLADSYYALKRYPDAIRIYTQVADQAGDYALYQIGQAFYNAGDLFEAIASFRRLLTEYGDSQWSEEAQYRLGYIYFQNQDYDQAIAEYRKIIERRPRDLLAAKAQYGIGDALFNAGQVEEAITAYTQVLERYPSSAFVPDAAAGIQYALAAVGDPARAEALIEDFAARHPESPVVDELRFRQAEVKYQSGRTDEALTDFQRFVRSSRNERLLPEAYFYLGTLYADQGQAQEAISYLRQVVDAYPGSARFAAAARRLGQLYLDAGRNQEALTVFRQLESRRSEEPRVVAEARYGQGVALLNMGRTQEAEQLLRDAVDTAPDAPETQPAYLGLAQVYEQTDRAAEAVRLYRRLVDRNQDEVGAEALYRLGTLLHERGDPRAAVEELSRMPVLFAGYAGWVARGYLAQARAFRSLGQRGDAVRLYDRVIEEFGGTPYAATATEEKAAL